MDTQHRSVYGRRTTQTHACEDCGRKDWSQEVLLAHRSAAFGSSVHTVLIALSTRQSPDPGRCRFDHHIVVVSSLRSSVSALQVRVQHLIPVPSVYTTRRLGKPFYAFLSNGPATLIVYFPFIIIAIITGCRFCSLSML